MHKKEQRRSTTIFSSMLRIMSLVLLLQISVVAFLYLKKTELSINSGKMQETSCTKSSVDAKVF